MTCLPYVRERLESYSRDIEVYKSFLWAHFLGPSQVKSIISPTSSKHHIKARISSMMIIKIEIKSRGYPDMTIFMGPNLVGSCVYRESIFRMMLLSFETAKNLEMKVISWLTMSTYFLNALSIILIYSPPILYPYHMCVSMLMYRGISP